MSELQSLNERAAIIIGALILVGFVAFCYQVIKADRRQQEFERFHVCTASHEETHYPNRHVAICDEWRTK